MWAIAALLTAVFWGFSYAASERLMKIGLQPSFMMAITAIMGVPAYGFLAWKNTNIRQQLTVIKDNPGWGSVAVFSLFIYMAANYLSYYAIQHKNATSVSLIEMSYPLFTAFFAWLIFRETQFNIGTIIGAAMMLTGISIVTIYSK